MRTCKDRSIWLGWGTFPVLGLEPETERSTLLTEEKGTGTGVYPSPQGHIQGTLNAYNFWNFPPG